MLFNLTLCVFVFSFKDHTCLKDETIRIKSLQIERYENSQPYVAVCGKNLVNLNCFHVVIGVAIIDFDSIILAVDYLFKFLHVTSMNYPTISLSAWDFLHHCVYKMSCSAKSMYKLITSIKTLVVELEAAKKHFYSPVNAQIVSNHAAEAENPIQIIGSQLALPGHSRQLERTFNSREDHDVSIMPESMVLSLTETFS